VLHWLQVLLIAVFFSLVCKKKDDVDEEEDPESDEARLQLAPDEEWMHQMQLDGTVQQRAKVRQPPTPLNLKKAREYRLKELKMYNVIREIVFYVIYVWALMVVSYGFRDPNSYHMKVSLDAYFTARSPEPGQIVNNVDFTQLLNQEDFWTWAQTVMAPALRAGPWYNGEQAVGQRGFVADRVGRLMGYATLRQLRVVPG
jgi:polycystin 1L2